MSRFTGYGVIAEKPLVRQLGQIFPCTVGKTMRNTVIASFDNW